MEKTKFPTANEVMQNTVELEIRLRDMMTIFAAIAMLQDDKMFSVPLATIEQLPKGASVDFSFNMKTREYEFTYVAPTDTPTAKELRAELVANSEAQNGYRVARDADPEGTCPAPSRD